MPLQVVFFVLLVAIAVNLAIMAALILAPSIERRWRSGDPGRSAGGAGHDRPSTPGTAVSDEITLVDDGRRVGSGRSAAGVAPIDAPPFGRAQAIVPEGGAGERHGGRSARGAEQGAEDAEDAEGAEDAEDAAGAENREGGEDGDDAGEVDARRPGVAPGPDFGPSPEAEPAATLRPREAEESARVERGNRARRRFRVPSHDDPRTSDAIQSFLDGPAPYGAERRPHSDRRRRSGESSAGDSSAAAASPARGSGALDAIWPVDPLTGLGNRIAWDALVAAESTWLTDGEDAAVIVLQVDPGRLRAGPEPPDSTGVRMPSAGSTSAPKARADEMFASSAAWMPALAGALRAELRSSDRLARLGPGLVAGLLAGTRGEQAVVVVERVRRIAEASLATRRLSLRVLAGAADVAASGGIEGALLEAARQAGLIPPGDDAPSDAAATPGA